MKEWHSKPIEWVFDELKTQIKGLSQEEAANRLSIYGYNELAESKKESGIQVFIRQFKNPIIYVLIFAAIIAAFLGHYLDATIIAIVLLANSVIGTIQEGRAEKSIKALKKLAAPKAKVKREGTLAEIPTKEIVPGDIIVFEQGDKIPTEARIIACVNLKMDEAMLTGESGAVEKFSGSVEESATIIKQKNIVFNGSLVLAGHGEAVAVATGMNTEVGKIAKFVQGAKEDIPILGRLAHFSKWIIKVVGLMIAITMAVSILRGFPIYDIILIVLSQAVSAVPEGLPVAVTVALSFGMYKMVKRNVLIRRLAAIETMGAITTICTDKTGTLTKNEMTITRTFIGFNDFAVTGTGYNPEGKFLKNGKESVEDEDLKLALRIGALCNNAKLLREDNVWKAYGDPTEVALIVVAYKTRIDVETLKVTLPRIYEIPFDSTT
ncbi:MAG: HAD-IC family P-type ATPase, partial [Candidatus Bathyarchaeota archaeon]